MNPKIQLVIRWAFSNFKIQIKKQPDYGKSAIKPHRFVYLFFSHDYTASRSFILSNRFTGRNFFNAGNRPCNSLFARIDWQEMNLRAVCGSVVSNLRHHVLV